ncbi:MAG: sulfatase-like hydrolase/transferase [Bryobacterales bacterium]|nr:sulfatase-like hydrolase/transferase [Bryobacterales bacterium]
MSLSSRREFLSTGAAIAAAPGLLSAQTRSDRPNVLVVVLDDLGCYDLGFLGAKDLRTPHLDAFARGAAVFTNWYSNAPVCAPARASIQSGRFPANAGVPTNGGELTPGIPCLGATFKQNGYRTASIGKWHLGEKPDTVPNAHGFDYFYGHLSGCIDFYSHRYYWGEPRRANFHDLWRNRDEVFEDGRYFTERIGEEAVAFLDANRNQPFCGYFAFNAPHYPMHAPDKYVDRFKELPLERRIYAAMVAAVDDAMGQIREALIRNGQLENTLLVFVGDNGATTEKRAGLAQEYAVAGSNGPFRGFKFSLFDGGMHVPAFIHWPARVKPGKHTQVVQSMDIFPTLLAAAGIGLPSDLDGHSLLPVLFDGAASPHAEIFWTNSGQLAVRRGQWKLVINGRDYNRDPKGWEPLTGDDALFLSNVEEDPGESKNLRRLHPKLVDDLATAAQRWQDSLRKSN